MLGKLNIHKQKNEVGLLPYTITKIIQNGLKMKLRHESVKFLGKKIGEKLHDSGLR